MQKGNFKHLLTLIDKSGYKETMETGAGYWTFFAPNDAAFEDYFKNNHIGDINAIDSIAARKMIQYMLVYNSFSKNTLDDYQATESNIGWTPSAAFRRRTAYYTGFYKDTAATGPVVAIANNRNNIAGSLTGNYAEGDYNNKYLTYFIDDYMNAQNLSAADYNYFYPNSEYTGFNVGQAKVVNADIDAENGRIQELDKVITPQPSIDEYLRTKPEYSSFNAILNRLNTNNTISFIYNEEATNRYRILTGSGDRVYVKAYSNLLAYSPNNENFLKLGDNDGQKDCWTMFVPTNNAVDAYLKNTLLKYYSSLDSVPLSIITDFLNAHMFPTAVWPTKFNSTVNTFSEPARFDPGADVVEKKILSNGMFYGTNKVEQPDIFNSVYGEAYLNPKYTFMTKLFKTAGLNLLIARANIPVNIFLIPDQAFLAAGYTYNATQAQFAYKGSTGSVADRLDRIVRTCVYFGNYKEEVDNLSGQGIVKSGDADGEGEYIKFDNNNIVTAGLQDSGYVAHVDSSKTSTNGKVYYVDKVLAFSENGIGYYLGNLGDDTASNYNYFWQYLQKAANLYSTTTKEILGLNGYSTLFVPTNAAIRQAVIDGYLPGNATTGAPTFGPSALADVSKVLKFLQYHILSTHTAVPDGKTDPAMYDTYLKNSIGTTLRVRVENYKDAMNVVDDYGRTAHVIMEQSNNLANRCMVHLIDNYLRYND